MNGFGFGQSGESGASAGKTTQDILATVDVGGIESGDNFPAGTMIENIFRELIAPYVIPILDTLAVTFSPAGSEFDVGRTVNIVSAAFTVTNDSEGNPPQDMYITGDGFNKTVTTSPVTANPGSTAVLTTDSSKQWSLSGKDKDGNALTPKTATYYWRFRFFFGANTTVLTGASTPAEVKAVIDVLQQNALRPGKAWSVTCGSYNNDSGKYTYIAYAAKYGDLTSIIQNGALPVLGAFTEIGDFNYENAYGHTESYKVYKSNADGAFAEDTTLAIT